MNQENIHILNRFGFGPKLDWLNNPELKELLFDNAKLKQWLIQTAPEYSESTKYFSQTLKHRVEKSTDQWRKTWEYASYRVDWIDTMVELDNPIREKAALFWNHHIPISVGIWPFAQTLLLDCYRDRQTKILCSALWENLLVFEMRIFSHREQTHQFSFCCKQTADYIVGSSLTPKDCIH